MNDNDQIIDAEIIENKSRSIQKRETGQIDMFADAMSRYDVEAVLEISEKRNKILEALTLLALKYTTERHWIDMGGNPYLNEAGCQKVANRIGISTRIISPPTRKEYTDEKGKYYEYVTVVEGYHPMVGTKQATGSANSRDKLFSKGEKLKSWQVNPQMIAAKSETNAHGRLINRMIETQGITWEKVKQHYEGKVTTQINFSASKNNNQSPPEQNDNFPPENSAPQPQQKTPANTTKVGSLYKRLWEACYKVDVLYNEVVRLISGDFPGFKGDYDVRNITTDGWYKAFVANYGKKSIEEWVAEAESALEKEPEGGF